ncbi:hypothetical protein [Streptomyces sp. NPDC047065]|uniref:hypothetical protein n=1 Tax=Streptomyces sp. NPDC047065 TaxID=3154606 RepID=UPI0033CFCDC4
MSPLGRTFQITPEEMREIHDRLTPHFPPYLQRIEPNPLSWGLHFVFAPFTGREPEPCTPRSFYNDPRLTYVSASADEAEHLLREKAGVVMSNLYEAAREEWQCAAYVADLREAVKDAPHRWTQYMLAAQQLTKAFEYLRTPDAATEWPAAISRLVDAQDQARAAAEYFQSRAVGIARVHEEHRHSDLRTDQALERAGYPEAVNWHIGYFEPSYQDGLTEKVDRLIQDQEAHLLKVGRLAGLTP